VTTLLAADPPVAGPLTGAALRAGLAGAAERACRMWLAETTVVRMA
jgi:hypothetical protein